MEFRYENAPEAYSDLLYQMKLQGVEEDTRGGKVLRLPSPVLLTIDSPTERVITDPVRDANPFFHLLEAVWMLGGHNEVEYLTEFNKGFSAFAESDGIMRGAYGHRWRYHFGVDQLITAVRMLRKDPTSRRVVLSMWDAGFDLGWEGAKDYPCNTAVYLDIGKLGLNFTVCNRSNDLIWGAMGSNIVHMTIIQEALAAALNVDVGKYQLFTNNLHMYKERADFDRLTSSVLMPVDDVYAQGVRPFPITHDGGDGLEWFKNFLHECKAFGAGYGAGSTDPWLLNVALPMQNYHRTRTLEVLNTIQGDDWRWAAKKWVERRGTSSSSTSTVPSLTMSIEPIILEMPAAEIGVPTSPPAEATPPSTTSSS